MAGGGVLLAGVLGACTANQPPPASKGAPTLVPTVLPTAAPAGAVRPIASATTAVQPTATTPPSGQAQVAPSTPSSTAKRELTVLQGADVTTLDPHLSTFATDVNATFTLF